MRAQNIIGRMPEEETLAEIIYCAFPYDGKDPPQKPSWVPHGNSIMQDRARECARSILALFRRHSAPAPIQKFRKKPDEVEAWKYMPADTMPAWLTDALKQGLVYYQGGPDPYLTVDINGRKERARVGDYIVRDLQRIMFVVSAKDFEAAFESVETAAA